MISKTALHALHAVLELAQSEEPFVGSAQIAAKIGAPQNYLGKLLQNLAREGLVHSQKGQGGGFSLTRAPKDITVLDVVESIDHVSRWEGCFMGRESCSAKNPCPMHHRWVAVRNAYLEMLRKTTIEDIAFSKESKKSLEALSNPL